MGSETGKDSAGPIRRFPTGFWAKFNLWWHSEFARHGQRPSSKAIGKWHAENAVKVWGEHAVSYAETQRHANRMKCRRTGLHLSRNASFEDDDDEEDCCPDAAMANGARELHPGGAAEAGASLSDPASLPLPAGAGAGPAALEGCGGGSCTANGQPALETAAGINFDAHSDPPGALRGYMSADSDMPAPAAAPISKPLELLRRSSGGAGGPSMAAGAPNPTWMQPDPTVEAPHGGGLGCSNDASASSVMLWDSATSIFAAAQCSDPQSCAAPPPPPQPAAAHGSNMGAIPSTRVAVKRSREVRQDVSGGSSGSDVELRLTAGLPLPPRSNPFAEVAAAAAAAAGLPAARALPAARDAAALLNSSAMAAPLPTHLAVGCRGGAEPVWLRRVGTELDDVMRNMGLLSTDAITVALPGVWRRPRALLSSQPLRLPEPKPQRTLDNLLRRGLLQPQLQLPNQGGAAERPMVAPPAAVGCNFGMWSGGVMPLAVAPHFREVDRFGGLMGAFPHGEAATKAAARPWQQHAGVCGAAGLGAGGVPDVMAIETVPLNVLL